jgi:hypothetical protein
VEDGMNGKNLIKKLKKKIDPKIWVWYADQIKYRLIDQNNMRSIGLRVNDLDFFVKEELKAEIELRRDKVAETADMIRMIHASPTLKRDFGSLVPVLEAFVAGKCDYEGMNESMKQWLETTNAS